MRFVVLMLAGIGLSASLAGAAAPDAEVAKKVLDATQTRITAMSVSATYKVADVLQFLDKEGQLRINWIGPESTELKRVQFEGSKAPWVIERAGPIGVVGQPKAQYLVLVSRYDFARAAEGGPWMETLNLAPTYTHITATFGPGISICSLTWLHDGGMFRFHLTSLKDGQHGLVMTETASDFAHFRANHPQEVRKYIAPVLRDVTGVDWLSPGPGDVYRVFDQIAADPKVAAKIAGLLARLDSEIFSERETATTELAALGRPGVLAALRQDTSALTPEQKGRLAAFVALHSRRTINNPAAARGDVSFLLDSLEDEDPAVRSAAREALEKATGRKINLDLSQPADKLGAAVDALRQEVTFPSTQPTTQPQLDDETRRDMLKPAN